MQEVKQYLKKKFSLIPIQINSKEPPLIRWKQYQYKRASIEEVLGWYSQFGDINIAVITGSVSKLANIDVDDGKQLTELEKKIPNLWDTCRVKTPTVGHFQFYFSTDGEKIRSVGRLFNLDNVELRSEGRYVVCPGSKIDGVPYKFEKSLAHILPVPKIISGGYKRDGVLTGSIITGDNITIIRDIELPKFKAKCIPQILNYDLPYHRRKLGYFIAYCKMRQEGHKKSYAISLCKLANRNLSLPLTKKSDFDFGEVYPYGCVRINEELSFVDCSFCSIRGGLKVRSILMKNVHKLNTLTTSERSVLAVLDSYFRGESPSAYEVSKFIKNSNQHTIKMAIDSLKEKGII